MDNFIYGSVAFVLGVVVTLIICARALSDAATIHHRDAYDEYGRLTCEICKALVEKGAK